MPQITVPQACRSPWHRLESLCYLITMLEQLSQELASLEAQALRRRLQVLEEVLPGGKVRLDGRVLLNLSSNDYLGLAQDPRLIAAAQDAAARWGAGAGASRLVAGHLALHEAVEDSWRPSRAPRPRSSSAPATWPTWG